MKPSSIPFLLTSGPATGFFHRPSLQKQLPRIMKRAVFSLFVGWMLLVCGSVVMQGRRIKVWT